MVCCTAIGGLPAHAADTPDTRVGGDFTLINTVDGAPFSLADARGKVVLMLFGYTSCPDICPTTLFTVQSVLRRLGDQAREIQPLFVSVDPARDTPKMLRDYVEYFDPSILALTGSQAQLSTVTQQYRTFYRYRGDTSSKSYEVDHGTNFYVIDQQGRLKQIIPFGTPLENIVASVKALLPG
jgi:protein SCO1/2